MSEQQSQTATPSAVQVRSSPEGYASWPEYWKAQGIPWRTEPEIDEERQRHLAERRAIQPDIEQGIYPFKDIRLNRGDVEWLLATHESGGRVGPVKWSEEKDKPGDRRRWGLDMRGAILAGTNLSHLPLTCLIAALPLGQADLATRQQRRTAVANMERADLADAHVEAAQLRGVNLKSAYLRNTHLEVAVLVAARLEDASLDGTHLEGADMRNAVFDGSTYLSHMRMKSPEYGALRAANTRWASASIDRVDWSDLDMLGDEQIARRQRSVSRHRTNKSSRALDYQRATRANRQLSTALRSQGLNEDADHFAYRAQLC